MHALAPLEEDQVPVSHLLHVVAPGFADHDPAAQLTQAAAELAPEALNHVPGRQLMHTLESVAAVVEDHVPALQAMHTVPLR